MLRQLAEAEAKRAESTGSAATSQELQSKLADSIERIVEQVGGGCSWRVGASSACQCCEAEPATHRQAQPTQQLPAAGLQWLQRQQWRWRLAGLRATTDAHGARLACLAGPQAV